MNLLKKPSKLTLQAQLWTLIFACVPAHPFTHPVPRRTQVLDMVRKHLAVL